VDDKGGVNSFWTHAEEIFSTARQNREEDCGMAILVGHGGAIRVTSAEGWNLESLRLHHGAVAAYQVTRRDGRVRVSARSAEASCVLEDAANRPVLDLLAECPRYEIVSRSLQLSAA